MFYNFFRKMFSCVWLEAVVTIWGLVLIMMGPVCLGLAWIGQVWVTMIGRTWLGWVFSGCTFSMIGLDWLAFVTIGGDCFISRDWLGLGWLVCTGRSWLRLVISAWLAACDWKKFGPFGCAWLRLGKERLFPPCISNPLKYATPKYVLRGRLNL